MTPNRQAVQRRWACFCRFQSLLLIALSVSRMCLFGAPQARRLVLYRHILRSFVIFKSCIVKNRNKNLKRIVKFANFFAYFIVKNAKFLLTERFFMLYCEKESR